MKEPTQTTRTIRPNCSSRALRIVDIDRAKPVRKRSRSRKNVRVERHFTEAEMRELLRRARQRAARGNLIDRADYALIVFAYATGCRVGEIATAGLSRSQPNYLDLRAGVLTIREAKCDSAGSVPLDMASLRVLRRYVRDVRPHLRNAAHCDRLFLSKTGRPYSPNALTQKFGLMLARFGFRGKTAHAFRHYYCTDLLRRGVAPHVVQALARHRDARTTLGIYAHPSADDLRAAVLRRAN
jgi:site-specific recombinase XerD